MPTNILTAQALAQHAVLGQVIKDATETVVKHAFMWAPDVS